MLKYSYFIFDSTADTALIQNKLHFISVFNIMEILLVILFQYIASICNKLRNYVTENVF